jgi:hypothetical protein
MPSSTSSKLREAMHDSRLIRFANRFEKANIQGYVAAVGTRWALFRIVSDRIRFDGFECFLIRDLSKVRDEPYTAFIETALRKRKERRGAKPRIDLSDTGSILRSAAKVAPLVTIHIEKIDPGVCYIGQIGEIDGKTVALREISPSASWDESFESYRLKDITRVGFGADYESALHLVAGDPRKLAGTR